MLSTDRIQALFGRVLSPLYEGAVLEIWVQGPTRTPASGTFPYAKQTEAQVKVQRDECTEAQRGQDGYVAGDVRFLVLQSGVLVTPNTDSRVRYRGQNFRVMSVDADPARVYWDLRARLMP